MPPAPDAPDPDATLSSGAPVVGVASAAAGQDSGAAWSRGGGRRVADRPLCVVRGGGDLATGVVWRLTRAGLPVIVTELADPLTVRRTVAVSEAVAAGSATVEGMSARLVSDGLEAVAVALSGDVAVLVSPGLPDLPVPVDVVVDARLAKRNIDTSTDDAPLVVALGPGFTAGADCHAVVETMRGHHLGRVLWEGSAAPNTGTPGVVAGRGVERVLRAPAAGRIRWAVAIGDIVEEGQVLGRVVDAEADRNRSDDADAGGSADVEAVGAEIRAPFASVVRGLIRDGATVAPPLKIGDVDPRSDTACDEISDKALAMGGGVLEAVLWWWSTAAPR